MGNNAGRWIRHRCKCRLKQYLVCRRQRPLYHVFALTGALSFFSTGTQTVLVANPRDMPAFLKTLNDADQTEPLPAR